MPGSNPRMLEKSLTSPADCVAYDLEDAVSVNQKAEARRLVSDLLNARDLFSLLRARLEIIS